jgi:hypothetical protein
MPNIRQACERPGSVVADPFGATPVTSGRSSITYRNYYCAVCNSDSENVKFWQPRLECPTLTGYSNRFKNITREFIEKRLKFDESRGQWGVEIDTGGIPVFHECYVDPSVPANVMKEIRQSLVSSVATSF